MTTTAEPASFPVGMRRMGWLLAGLMLLYPVGTFLGMRATREQFAVGRAAREAQVPSSGMQFDLRTVSLHCGPIGWAGAWAFMIGVVWALVAGGLSLYYRLTKTAIAKSSLRAFLVVAAGVATVVGTMILEWSQ